MTRKFKAAVITEWHPFDVINFQRLFWAFDDAEVYIQSLDLFCQDPRNDEYEVVVYYNLSSPTPEPADPRRVYIEKNLGVSGQGIVLLHHGILSYPEWDAWDQVSGVANRRFRYHPQQSVRYTIDSSNDHPVTKGLSDFSMVDETYQMPEPDVGDNRVLISTDHANSMKSIAWAREFRKSRVFCYQSGHDQTTYGDPNFREILHRGMLWAAGQLG